MVLNSRGCSRLVLTKVLFHDPTRLVLVSHTQIGSRLRAQRRRHHAQGAAAARQDEEEARGQRPRRHERRRGHHIRRHSPDVGPLRAVAAGEPPQAVRARAHLHVRGLDPHCDQPVQAARSRVQRGQDDGILRQSHGHVAAPCVCAGGPRVHAADPGRGTGSSQSEHYYQRRERVGQDRDDQDHYAVLGARDELPEDVGRRDSSCHAVGCCGICRTINF
uniref:Uncharacterized protein n=1 Tax=Hyaloperonospora arabidopsidis (strain Emoy2) TaxID=559515 RepID=M4BVX5_HYAAE